MDKSLQLVVITPTKTIFNEKIYSVLLNSVEGEMVVRPGHTSVTCALKYGISKFTISEGNERKATIMGGFAEITGTKVTILTDAAEWPEDIDASRATEAQSRAKTRLAEKGDGLDIGRAEAALARAAARLELK